LSDIYRNLAEEEEKHARLWENKLLALGQPVPSRQVSMRIRFLGWLAKRFGPGLVLPTVMSMEQTDSRRYDSQDDARAETLPAAERAHARTLRAITGKSRRGLTGGEVAELEGRHRAIGGNALRAAVLGANDGLVSNFSLVMGVAGAELSSQSILITGLAGLLAGASSMALGEWLSVQSSRELHQRQIQIEARELEDDPEGEAEELALIYEAKGITRTQARQMAAQLMLDKKSALDTLVREELGIDPKELGGSAWEAAITSFVLFSIGAVIPVAPFMILSGMAAVVASVLASLAGLFVIGAGITLMTGRNVLFSGGRQVLFGMAAAALTFGIGRLIGASLAG
jgi:VIT1/CCC1 family predicted Fe2+/Mn2+ transporter